MSDSWKVNIWATNENETDAMETKDATTSTGNQNIVDIKGKADVEKVVIKAAAGVETKIENYQNNHTQRRHYAEEGADEMTDVTNGENADDAEGAVEIEEEKIAEEEAAQNKWEEFTDAKEAARIEKGIVEDCEGVRTQRKHFPGSTTSHIFG